MSFTLQNGAKAPDFDLPGSNGRDVRFSDVRGNNGTLIFFTCNHCPFVVGSEARMKALFDRCQSLGITMTAIHSNETKDHPTDDFPSAIARAREMDFKWLSLRDDKQLIAREYGAERTPHYFLFDKDDTLVYAGRMDDSPRDASKVQTSELEDAIADMRGGRPAKIPRTDAIGCNIKWWDKDAHWMPKEACDLDYLYQREPTSQA